MKQYFLLLFRLFFSSILLAQVNVRDSSVFAPLASLSYAYQIPSGDLVKNYGPNSNIAGSCLFKFQSNWVLGMDAGFIFGNLVKDTTVLNNLRNSQGQIIDQNGQFASIIFYERGYSVFARAGRVFSFKKPNPNSGILFLSGAGFLQHKMRIEVNNKNVPQLSAEYRKGYDRLRNGFALSQFFGYQYLGSRKLINFFAGVEVVAGFTQNRRGYNYDTMEYDNEKRLDILNGIRFGWILPLYKKVPKDFYFY